MSQRSHPSACTSSPPRVARSSRFNGKGSRLPGDPSGPAPIPATIPADSAEAAALGDGTVGFRTGGSLSIGPETLPADGAFALESVMPYENQALAVRIVYEDGVRAGMELRWAGEEGGRRGRVDGSMLDAGDIAGRYVARSVRWAAGGSVSVMERLERDYGMANSRSDMLVRLPLGVSVVAPRVWGRGKLSFGCGWTPVDGRRPVMVRSYGDDGRLAKVDWRVEERVERF